MKLYYITDTINDLQITIDETGLFYKKYIIKFKLSHGKSNKKYFPSGTYKFSKKKMEWFIDELINQGNINAVKIKDYLTGKYYIRYITSNRPATLYLFYSIVSCADLLESDENIK